MQYPTVANINIMKFRTALNIMCENKAKYKFNFFYCTKKKTLSENIQRYKQL